MVGRGHLPCIGHLPRLCNIHRAVSCILSPQTNSRNINTIMAAPGIGFCRSLNISRYSFSRQRSITILGQTCYRRHYSNSFFNNNNNKKTPKVAVLFQAIDPPVINNVRKPRKPGGKNSTPPLREKVKDSL